MNVFKSREDLRKFLREDRDKGSLNPVRFVNVDSMEMWVEVKKTLLSIASNNMCLSDFCSDIDTTPNMTRFHSYIQKVTESVCIYPLSEYLRINPDKAESTILKLIKNDYPGNNNGKLRIYIPMYRMKSVLQKIQDSDPRRLNCINLLATGDDPDYSLTVIQDDLKISVPGNEIIGFKKYLQYWEQNPDKPIILHSENAIHFSKKVFFDNVRIIVNAFDLLVAYYHLPIIYKEEDGKKEYWNRLAEVVSKEDSFENACCHELLINHYTPKLFEKWSSLDDFQKWLLWMWAREKQPDGYLGFCISKSKDVAQFKSLLYFEIIRFIGDSRYEEIFVERKQAIQNMHLSASESFLKEVNQLSILDQLHVLSDATSVEREKIFSLLKEVPKDKREEAIKIIKIVYPALGNYLLCSNEYPIEDLPEDILNYFDQYRWYKAENVLPKSFVKRVKTIAREKGTSVYALQARNLIVSEEYDENTAIVFVDGMGVEYMNYLTFVFKSLKDEGYNIRNRVGYCNLPSTTFYNKDFLLDRKVVQEFLTLDEMKHGSNSYPRTLENEFNFLDSLGEVVRSAFGPGIRRVILTTDHGTSRMAVLVRSTEYDQKHSSNGHKIYKYGRYCEGTDMSEEFDTAIESEGNLIFADYQRFEQKGAPIDETHGGATLEEWLVPIIIIEKFTSDEKRSIAIIPPVDTLRPDPKTKRVTVQFSLDSYIGANVTVRIQGKKFSCIKTEGQYKFEYLPEKQESEIVADVYIDSKKIDSFKFSVKMGIIHNRKFDL